MLEAFEPAEKRLELSLRPEAPSLLTRGPEFWTQVVQAARAEIVRERHRPWGSSYLLSESSLFVFQRRLVMLTCGRSTLAAAASLLVDALGPAALAALCFERRPELRAEAQLSSFADDVRVLSARLLGEVRSLGSTLTPALQRFLYSAPGALGSSVPTLELFMFDVATVDTSASRRTDGLELDEHHFEPSGYSMNALGPDVHRALHVTPTASGTYVGFDASGPDPRALEPLLDECISRFRPKRWQALLTGPGTPARFLERGPGSELAQ